MGDVEENVELALAAVDAWNRGDREAWLALWDEEVEFIPLRAQLEGESYRGHEGLERFLAEMAEQWRCALRSRRRETQESRWSAIGRVPGSRASERRRSQRSAWRIPRVRRRSCTRACSRSQRKPSKLPAVRVAGPTFCDICTSPKSATGMGTADGAEQRDHPRISHRCPPLGDDPPAGPPYEAAETA